MSACMYESIKSLLAFTRKATFLKDLLRLFKIKTQIFAPFFYSLDFSHTPSCPVTSPF